MMKRNRVTTYLVISVLVAVALLTAALGTSCAPKERTLRMLGASEGSKTQMGYVYLAKMVFEEKGILTTSLPGAEEANYELLSRGDADITYGHNLRLADFYLGKGKSEGKPHLNLRNVMSMVMGFPYTIAVLGNSNIDKIEDLLGKRIATGEPGSGTELAGQIILEAGYGLTRAKIQAAGGALINLSKGDMTIQLADRTVDAIVLSSTIDKVDPIAVAAEALGPGVRLLVPSKEATEKIKKAYPGIGAGYIKGGVYKNHPQDLFTVSVGYVIVTSAEVPNDIIYDFLDVVTKKEHRQRIYDMVGWDGFGGFVGDKWTNMYLDIIPIHPGAAKWFRDNGHDISGLEVGK